MPTKPDFVTILFSSAGEVAFERYKDTIPRPVSTKSYQDVAARIKALHGITVEVDPVKIPVHKVAMRFATPADDLGDKFLVYKDLEAFLETVPYEERGYPLRCAGWMSAAFERSLKEKTGED